MKMKQFLLIFLVFILCSAFIVSCSSKEDLREYFVIERTMELLFSSEEVHLDLTLLGEQYYQDQAVQIRAEIEKDEEAEATMDLYLCKDDGSKELLMSDVSKEYQRHNWFLSEGKYFFVWSGEEIAKIDLEGTEIFHKHLDGRILDICQLNDGKVILLVHNVDKRSVNISEIDVDTGEIDDSNNIYVGENTLQYINAGENGVLLLNQNGIFEYNLRNKNRSELFVFGESYKLFGDTSGSGAVSGFRVTDEGKAEIWRGSSADILTNVNIGETKEIVIVRISATNYILENFVTQFNEANDIYYVVIETMGEDESLADFNQRTNVELSVGKGPDIVCNNMISDVNVLIEDGLLVNLAPYLENSGIKEEDYFPTAFSAWRENDKIYTVCTYLGVREMWISEELLGNREDPNIETLVNALLNYEKKAVFHDGWDSALVLEYFLCGSENLWGMIDWTDRSCDFSGELFAKMLKAAKQYGYDERNTYPELASFRNMGGVYRYEWSEQLASEGKVPVGWLFDDGCHVNSNVSTTMAISNNSLCKEGALEFIEFMLSEEGQSLIIHRDTAFPVSKKVFDILIEEEIESGSLIHQIVDGRSSMIYKGGGNEEYERLGYDADAYKALYDITEERGEEIRNTLEDARLLPTKTKEILAIVYEEAGAYFAGTKSVEEVVEIIENRVQLYLDETK